MRSITRTTKILLPELVLRHFDPAPEYPKLLGSAALFVIHSKPGPEIHHRTGAVKAPDRNQMETKFPMRHIII